ncbi:MAG TPA: hypothetical protein VH144_02605 [Candidatus Saccharimonadales bacterium]|jgi:hypothetical protein|nr:hypothetical protein [Candidatus Saccharimonadales bacterium]
MKYRLGTVMGGILLGLLLSWGSPLHAATPDRGLFITPSRQYPTVHAGQTVTQSLTVANLTENDMTIALSVEQFSVADYNYDYAFYVPKDNWVYVEKNQLSLGSGQSQKLAYTIKAPTDATPGGHYFTIFASVTLASGEHVRAAMVVYVTVDGKLVKTSAITHDTFPMVSFGGDIPFKLDVQDKGNTHFFIYTLGTITDGIITKSVPETGHILLPKTTRTVDYVIPTPIMPGLYRANYGYKTDNGQIVQKTKLFLYAPLWSFAVAAGLVWFSVVLIRRHQRLSTKNK